MGLNSYLYYFGGSLLKLLLNPVVGSSRLKGFYRISEIMTQPDVLVQCHTSVSTFSCYIGNPEFPSNHYTSDPLRNSSGNVLYLASLIPVSLFQSPAVYGISKRIPKLLGGTSWPHQNSQTRTRSSLPKPRRHPQTLLKLHTTQP